MLTLEEAAEQLGRLLRQQPADYVEARLSQGEATHISYRGRQLESLGRTSVTGGCVRALVRGGWGFVSFNDLKDLPEKVALAVRQAGFAGREESRLAPVEPAIETVGPAIGEDPVAIPLATKKALLDEYNAIITGTEGVQTSIVAYGDSRRRSIFLSSLGSRIEQERRDVTLRLAAIAARDGDVQQVGISVGGRDDFGPVRNLHAEAEGLARRAVRLLSAPRVKGGEYTVVLDPVLAGVFVHEAFGHLSEADFVYQNDRLRQIMQLGTVFGPPHLNIVDSAQVPGLRGSFRYDDEGVPAAHTYLIREGKLVGRLHSRETAARMNETPTGNARALSYRHPPIVRMTNTFIEPGEATFDDLLAGVDEGVYACNWYGGTTSMEMFTFSAGEAFMIRHGRIAEAIRPVVLSGNVFETLKNIDAIGNDLKMNQGGGCGKGGQSPLPVSNGSPHIRIRRCLVGGG